MLVCNHKDTIHCVKSAEIRDEFVHYVWVKMLLAGLLSWLLIASGGG
jgi:hypothetical protein